MDAIDFQKETLGINDFIESSKSFIDENFGNNIDVKSVYDNLLNGEFGGLLDILNVENILEKEFSNIFSVVGIVLIIICINSLFKSILESLNNSSASQNLYFVQYLLISTLLINAFMPILEMTKNTITSLIGFMNLYIPVLILLIITTGNFVTSSAIEPVLLIMIEVIGNIVINIIIPFLLVSIVISIVANFSNKIKLDRISSLFKSGIVWALGVILTIFITVLSFESNLTSSVDGLAGKTTKAAVSGLIPVVGKIMGDSVDSVIGSVNVLKNAVGTFGTIVIILIVLIPTLKIICYYFLFKLTAAVSEMCADERIVKLLDSISDSYKILLGILCSITIMFIIGTAIIVKVTNMSLMYR